MVRYWGKNLIDQRCEEIISGLLSLSFPNQKGIWIFLSSFLLLPMVFYIYPGCSKTYMANSGQPVATSAPNSRLYFIVCLGVSVQTNIPQLL